MSNDKEIRIRAVLDASTFDKGVNEIQEKLKKITQTTSMGAGATQALGKDSVLGKYAQQAFGDFSKDSQKQLEQMYQTQRREAVNQSITMKGKQAELAKMAQIDGEMTKQQKERVTLLKQEIDLLKEKQRQTLGVAAETQKALDKMKPKEEPAAGGGDAGGPPAPQGGGAMKDHFGKFLKQVGVASIISGSINAAMQTVDDMITRDRKINVNNASSLNMMSREQREQFEGRGSRGMFWLSERQRAMSAANQEQQSVSTMDKVKGWGGTALQGIGLGTMIGTGWTGLGLGVGAGLMGAGTAMKGGIVGDERTRAAMFDREKYKALNTREGLEKYEQNLAAEKAKDPRKALAQEYFESNRGNIAGLERILGVNDSQLMGKGGVGLMQRNMQYGGQYGGVNFNQATIEEQISALAQGGAMTGGVQDLSGAAATYNRQFNLGNAGGVMGKIQGNTGMNSSLTDMAYQRLLTEAVRSGVDASTMPRELERMTQMTAELVTSGGVNAMGMEDVFGAGLGGFNQKSLSAAASAAEQFRSTAKEAGGWEGQMGMGFLQGGKASELLGGKQLSSKDMNYLNQLSYTEMDESGFQRVGEYLGIDPGKAKELLRQKDMYKQTRTGAEDTANNALGQFLKGKGQMSPEELNEALSSGEGAKLFTEAESQRGARGEGFMQKDVATRKAEVLAQARLAVGAEDMMTPEDAEAKVAGQKSRKETRAAYIEEGSEATGDMVRMDALNDQLENLKKAATNHTKYAEEYNKQFELLLEATKKGASSMDAVASQLTELERKMREDSAQSGVYSGRPPGQ